MTGRGSADTFVRCVVEDLTRENVDIITDFNHDEGDSIAICRDALPGLRRIKFKSAASKKNFKKEQLKSSNIIYLEKKGELWYDANGRQKGFGEDGGIFMILENKAPLASGDFSII